MELSTLCQTPIKKIWAVESWTSEVVPTMMLLGSRNMQVTSYQVLKGPNYTTV